MPKLALMYMDITKARPIRHQTLLLSIDWHQKGHGYKIFCNVLASQWKSRNTRQTDMGRNTKQTIQQWCAESLTLPLETIRQACYRIKQASVACQDSKWHPLWDVRHLVMSRGTSQTGDRFNRDRTWRSACLSFQHLQVSFKPLRCLCSSDCR